MEKYTLSMQQRHGLATCFQPSCFGLLEIECSGDVQEGTLKRALEEVVRRNEILRTRIVSGSNGMPAAQVIKRRSKTSFLPSHPPISARPNYKRLFISSFQRGKSNRIELRVAFSAMAADRATLDMFVGELSQQYYREIENSESGTEPQSLQYADYAAWLDEQLSNSEAVVARERVIRRLTEEIKATSFLSYGKRGPFRPMKVVTALTSQVTRLLRSVALKCNCEVEDILLAVWQMLLCQLDGFSLPPVGVLLPARTLPEMRRSLGPYDYYLPVFAKSPPRDLTEAISIAVAGKKEAALLVNKFCWDESRDEKSFPFIFSSTKPGWDSELFRVTESSFVGEVFRLGLECMESPDLYRMILHFDTACCSEGEAQTYLNAYSKLLEVSLNAPLSGPYSVIGESIDWDSIKLQPTANQQEATYGRTEWPLNSKSKGLAVVDVETKLTYEELDEQGNKLARYLLECGIKAGTSRVGLLFERNVRMALGVVAVLKSGAAFVPLDLGWPSDYLRDILAKANVSMVLTDKLHNSEASGYRILNVVDEASTIHKKEGLCLPEKPHIDFPAYLIFTSGSTGPSKGAIITRRNLDAYLFGLRKALGVRPKEVYLHTAPFCFSSSIRQLLLPLTVGAVVLIASGGELRNPTELIKRVVLQKVNILDLVPSYWRRFINALEKLELQSWNTCQLRLALSASEVLPTALADNILACLPKNARLINMYGLTETSGIVSCFDVKKGQREIFGNQIPIGRSLCCNQLFVVDDDLRMVPPGGLGEICVVGPPVGAYLQDSNTSQRTFPIVSNSLRTLRVCRTGDLGRQRSDSLTYLLGRIDSQVKIRGKRVELSGIERQLGQHPKVENAVVTVVSHPNGDSELVAYVVPRGRESIISAEILAFAERRLPSHCVPHRIQIRSALPLTFTGKVDRRSLVQQVAPHGSETTEVGTGSVTARLAKIWQHTIRQSPTDGHGDFFAQGGDSLLAIDLLEAVSREFNMALSWQVLFETPTFEQLVVRITEALAAQESQRSSKL